MFAELDGSAVVCERVDALTDAVLSFSAECSQVYCRLSNKLRNVFRKKRGPAGLLTRPNVARRLFLFQFMNSLATVTQQSGD